MGRKSRKKRSRPNISPLSVLRPQLDRLFGSPNFAEQEMKEIENKLQALIEDIESNLFLPILLKAYQNASPAVQTRLDDVIPNWLAAEEYDETLIDFIQKQMLDPEDQKIALQWLGDQGHDIREIKAEIPEAYPFYKAFIYEDEFGSQAHFSIMWYTDHHKSKTIALHFLFDYNPPWEGAVKDSFYRITKADRINEMELHFDNSGLNKTYLSDAEAKQILFEALDANRSEGIRLPKDLIAMRNRFWELIPTLPDSPTTIPFTPQDFELMSQQGQSPEQINQFERTVGRRARIDDQEVFFVGGDEVWLNDDDHF